MEVIQICNYLDNKDKKFKNPQIGRVYSSEGLSPCIDTCGGGNREVKIMEVKLYQYPRGFDKGGLLQGDICPTISKSSWENNCFLIECNMDGLKQNYNNDFYNKKSKTIYEGVKNQEYRIRKLTPKECFRLMGVGETEIDILLNSGISNAQLYKMAGNSIVVDVLYHIFRKLFIEKENENLQLTLF